MSVSRRTPIVLSALGRRPNEIYARPTSVDRSLGKRLVCLAVALAVPAAAISLAHAALVVETPVLTSRASEETPAAAWNADGTIAYLAYAKNSLASPRRFNAYLRAIDPADGSFTVVKLNAVGRGYLGGIDPPTVVYQQIYNGRSNLKLYDVETGKRRNPPSGINTLKWEWAPTISGSLLLFNRDDNTTVTQRVIMHDLTKTTGAETVLSKTTRSFHSTYAGQVNGNWAVWARCTPICGVFRRDLVARTTIRLARPTNFAHDQYAPSVDSHGTVYLARSGRACGSIVRIVRYTTGDITAGRPGTAIAQLPPQTSLSATFARGNGNGTVDVLYDRLTCNTGRSDIYKITDAPPTAP